MSIVTLCSRDLPMYIHVNKRGFTLTEVVMAIAILTIVLSLAAPSFQDLIAQSRLSAISSQLRTSLLTARSEAITSNRKTTVCASEDQSSCSNGSWVSGSIALIVQSAGIDPALRVCQLPVC